MLPRLKFALLVGAVLATGASAAVAEMNQSQAGARGNYGGGRGANHFLADYDQNHDGKVTKDEFNRALGARYAGMAHGQAVNAQQYAADAEKRYREREAKYFHRADWNGDGKLTLDEYVAPLRARFSYADRKSAGFVDCAQRGNRAGNFGDANKQGSKRHGHSSRGMCFTSDLNQDGKVTHAEYDAANAKKFAEAVHGGKTLNFDQFVAMGRTRNVGSRIFQHLDSNNDGKLSLAEYAAPKQKQFGRLDKNHDGVVTRDEAASSSRGGGAFNHRFATRQ